MHGNGRYGHYKDSDFRPKLEKCEQCPEMVRFWTVASKIPPSVDEINEGPIQSFPQQVCQAYCRYYIVSKEIRIKDIPYSRLSQDYSRVLSKVLSNPFVSTYR